MKARQPRTLESFTKADLVTLIRNRLWHSDPTSDLIWIEYQRVYADYMAQTETILAEMKACKLPQDWERYKSLDGQWTALQRKMVRAEKAVAV